MELVTRPTALIDRDYYMFMFRAFNDDKVPDKELIESNILICLNSGFDVIFEGNFKMTTHKQLLERIFEAHPDENFVFYLQASLAETLRRHQMRSVKIISEQEMSDLYPYATPAHHPGETIVPEHSSLEETLNLIRRTAEI